MKPIFQIVLRPISNLIKKGSTSLFNLSSYVFGISATLVTLGAIILPYKVLDIINAGSVTILGITLGKNGLLGLTSLIGGLTASLIQPLAGLLSDKNMGPFGKRLPFLVIGGIGVAVSTLFLVPVETITGLIVVYLAINLFGNLGEGPANALLKDHVVPKKFGSASGVFNFSRVLGSAIVLFVTLQFMKNYSGPKDTIWLWASLGFISFVMIFSTFWSLITLNPTNTNTKSEYEEKKPNLEHWHKNKKKFIWFILALSLSVTALSTLQTFAIFFVNDVVIQNNSAQTLAFIIVILFITIGIVVIPAGNISDKIGRKPLLLIASITGFLGPILMIPLHTLFPVLLGCGLIGITVGLIISVFWAVANDLVPRDRAGKMMGFTALAFLVGSGIARSSGFLVDWLNIQNTNLGYYFLLLLAAICFLISPLIVIINSVEED